MKTRNGLLLALGAGVLVTALAGTDAAAQRGRNNPAAASSVQCASGAQPSAATNAAQATFNRSLIPNLPAAQKNTFIQQAYDAAMAASAADANNPWNYYLAGQAALKLGQVARADSLLSRTVTLCPELAAEVTPLKAELTNSALEAARAALEERHDTTAAIQSLQLAAQLDSTNTDAPFFVAYLNVLRGNTAAAVPMLRRLLSGPAPAPTDSVARPRRTFAVQALQGYGGQLLNNDQNQQAVDALRAVSMADPQNHDAKYWRLLALYKMQSWDAIPALADSVVALGPLNVNAIALSHDAHKAIADRFKAQNNTAQENAHRQQVMALNTAADQLPVQFDEVTMSNGANSTTIRGKATGAGAAAGTPVRVTFTLTTPFGTVGTGTATITAPAKGASTNFEVAIPVTEVPTAFHYVVAR